MAQHNDNKCLFTNKTPSYFSRYGWQNVYEHNTEYTSQTEENELSWHTQGQYYFFKSETRHKFMRPYLKIAT
jgi:hypothetical protein